MKPDARGFTLVELAVTILLMGLLFGFAIPAFRNISASYQLKGATENMAAQIRLAREKAIATGSGQPMHFTANFQNSDYHMHYPTGYVIPLGKFPNGITFFSISNSAITMLKDGRVDASSVIVLQDRRANKDTVSVQISGLVLTK